MYMYVQDLYQHHVNRFAEQQHMLYYFLYLEWWDCSTLGQ